LLTDHGRPSRLWAAILAIVCPGLGHRYLGRPFVAIATAGVALLLPTLILFQFAQVVVAVGPKNAYLLLFLAPGMIAPLSVVDLFFRWDDDQDEVAPFLPLLLHAGLFGIAAAALAVAVPSYFVERYVVPSTSMLPLLRPGDELHVDRRVAVGDLRRGDVVVLREPGPPGAKESFLVKRIVGLPGDSIAFVGQELAESPRKISHCAGGGVGARLECIDDRCWALPAPSAELSAFRTAYEVTAPQLFVAGDLRENSEDSRARLRLGLPPFSVEDVVGRVIAHRAAGGPLVAVDVDERGEPYRCAPAATAK